MREQRKHFYNDHGLQGYLLAGLILLEITLVLLLLFYLFSELNQIIESHLYRIHNTRSASWPEILSLLATAMAGFLIVNIVALYLAHLIWGRYVRNTISLFSSGLDRIILRDFSGLPPSAPGQHRIIDLLEDWYSRERQRCQSIELQLEQLANFAGKPLTGQDREELQRILDDYRRLLTD